MGRVRWEKGRNRWTSQEATAIILVRGGVACGLVQSDGCREREKGFILGINIFSFWKISNIPRSSKNSRMTAPTPTCRVNIHQYLVLPLSSVSSPTPRHPSLSSFKTKPQVSHHFTGCFNVINIQCDWWISFRGWEKKEKTSYGWMMGEFTELENFRGGHSEEIGENQRDHSRHTKS